ncbi:MAG TPA: alpha/beta hydrolase [Nannocystis sp.]
MSHLEPRILERDGCPLHYWLAGDPGRPCLLLTHGAGLDHRLWRDNIPALAAAYRVLVWDVRGHGRSRPIGAPFTVDAAVADMLALLDAASAAEAVLIGQSMGGNLSQEFVRRHPERVRALVLVECVCNSAPLTRLERLALRLTPALLRLYPYRSLLRHSARSISPDEAVRAYCLDAMLRLQRDECLDVMMATLGSVRPDPAYRIPRPFTLVRGARSRAGSIAKQGPEWARREPLCRADVVIPEAGHCVNLEAPAAFNAAVLQFLATLDPPTV